MNKIKELRTKKGYTQTDIAKMLKITQATFSGWESGKFEIDNANLLNLSELLGVSIDYLLGNKKAPTNIDEVLDGVGTIKIEELELIKMYRFLDERGKKAVHNTMEYEYEQVKKGKLSSSPHDMEIGKMG